MKQAINAAIAILAIAAAGAAEAAGGDRAGRIDQIFERLDANGDDQIDRAELENARGAMFAAADADGDGLVTEAELNARASERAQKRTARMMERLDANDDGAISLAEFEKAPERRGGRMLRRLDANDDGVITRAEADAAAEKFRKRRGE